MARYTTSIASSLAPADAFAYMAMFSNALEWDPGVVEAARVDSGELRLGSTFRIVSMFAGRRVPLRYQIIALDADRSVVLQAQTRMFDSLDTITVEPTVHGSRVTYDARLVPKGGFRLADPLLQLLFQRVGRAADASLRRQLNRPSQQSS